MKHQKIHKSHEGHQKVALRIPTPPPTKVMADERDRILEDMLEQDLEGWLKDVKEGVDDAET